MLYDSLVQHDERKCHGAIQSCVMKPLKSITLDQTLHCKTHNELFVPRPGATCGIWHGLNS
eukprot:930087-Prymnesium_polylepis.1